MEGKGGGWAAHHQVCELSPTTHTCQYSGCFRPGTVLNSLPKQHMNILLRKLRLQP